MDGEARGRMCKECLHHGFNLARQKRIIRIEQADQVSARALVRGIQVGRHAAVRIAQQAYSVTAADIGGNHIAGIVLGGIIAYDDFRWGIGLRPCAQTVPGPQTMRRHPAGRGPGGDETPGDQARPAFPDASG